MSLYKRYDSTVEIAENELEEGVHLKISQVDIDGNKQTAQMNLDNYQAYLLALDILHKIDVSDVRGSR